MPTWNPCKRREFIARLRKLGFSGPFSGKRHQFMVFNGLRQTIPNNDEYSTPQLRVLVRQVEQRIGRGLTVEEWESL